MTCLSTNYHSNQIQFMFMIASDLKTQKFVWIPSVDDTQQTKLDDEIVTFSAVEVANQFSSVYSQELK